MFLNPYDLLTSRNPAQALEKLAVQLYPSKIRVEPNDKATKFLFGMSNENNDDLLQGATYNIVEKKNLKKVGNIKSPFQLVNSDDCQDINPLDPYDRAVLAVCVSEMLAGNPCTTPAIIYRGLTGKVNKGSDAKPHPLQREYILASVRRLMGKIFSSDISQLCEYLKYNNGSPMKFHSAILPACYIEAYVGGKDLTTIFFDRPSPLYSIADIKNQVLRYDVSLLDVPDQKNTRMNIELKNYAMCRIQETKLHKQLKPILTFDDIFKKCGLQNASLKTKMDARNTIEEFFKHLKDKKIIKDFELTKHGNKFPSITFKISFNNF